MTTANIPEVDALREQTTAAANAVRRRSQDVAQRQQELDREDEAIIAADRQEQADAALAARLLHQRREDDRADLRERRAVVDEEAGQMARIIVSEPERSPVPEPTPPAPEAPHAEFSWRVDEEDDDGLRVVHFDASASQGHDLNFHWEFGDGRRYDTHSSRTAPQYRAGRYEVALRVTDSSGWSDTMVRTVTVGPPPPAPEEPVAGTRVLLPQPTEHHVHVLNARHWTPVQWLLAILGVIIGVVVARYTWHPLFGDIRGTGRGVLTVLWFVALGTLGFFSGGFVGSLVDRRHR